MLRMVARDERIRLLSTTLPFDACKCTQLTDSPVGSEVENCFTVPLLLSLPLSATSVAVRLAQAGRPGISREELGWGMD